MLLVHVITNRTCSCASGLLFVVAFIVQRPEQGGPLISKLDELCTIDISTSTTHVHSSSYQTDTSSSEEAQPLICELLALDMVATDISFKNFLTYP